MIRPLLALLLCSCSTPLPEPCLPAPGEWVESALPSGVLARADLSSRVAEWDRRLLEQPHIVVAAVVLHERCHLKGYTSEDAADCCAAKLFVDLYGVDSAPQIVDYWLEHDRRQRAIVWLVCSGEVDRCLR